MGSNEERGSPTVLIFFKQGMHLHLLINNRRWYNVGQKEESSREEWLS
ncbi:hypothetical protein KKC1_10250 [Calderihabitans maritimus]|uniref:Uncharacterized protein n=1 Tax=Calderihabitans maritimus TaxID=1246530 RepID=A0A1Z5HQS7_9FIRM|nr:hypothetical protein KKC1_10250 [Calderihabitans maritimus]